MEDWLTYRLSDLLLFSPRTYYRLFELYNRDLWPAHLMSFAAVVGSLLVLRDRTARQATVVMVVLSAVWVWIAWAFHLQRYATINWAARYFALAFVLQGALMFLHGVRERRAGRLQSRAGLDRSALGLTLFALLFQPLVGPLVGREWTQLETFGAAPDPTAVATLGILPLVNRHVSRLLLIVPAVWCAISGATLWAMGSLDAPLVPLAGLTGAVIAFRARRA